MKDQYFGDVNDYRKYGLLRVLQKETGFRIGIWWMLTPDDARRDGTFTTYLKQPALWRRFDPPLFDTLANVVPQRRSIAEARAQDILGECISVDEIVADAIPSRAECFARAKQALSSVELIFLDPDNGLEVSSCPAGRKGSSKYVLRNEITDLYSACHSLIVYQHFPRQERGSFIRQLGETFQSETGAPTVTCFGTSNAAFFLLPQAAHQTVLSAASDRVSEKWASQISVLRDCQSL